MGVAKDLLKILGTMSEDISAIRAQGVQQMIDLTNLQTADATVAADVATLLTDFATALGNAADPAAIQKVADDMNATAASIRAADPNATA
jgi:hypothetical protein